MAPIVIGHLGVIDLRSRGLKPAAAFVSVEDKPVLGIGLEIGSFPQISVTPQELGPTCDWRFLVGMRVHVCAEHVDDFLQVMADIAEAGATEIYGWCASTDELVFYRNGQWESHPLEVANADQSTPADHCAG